MSVAIRTLSAGETEALIAPLSVLLSDCVADGANVNFILPFPPEKARDFWVDLLPALERGHRRLYVAEVAGEIAGTVQLDIVQTPNGAHRCEVAKLMVHPNFRGRGIARALMARHEEDARALGKTLIVLDTKTGSEAETLYASLGFSVAGQIPNFAREPDHDVLISTTYMFKVL